VAKHNGLTPKQEKFAVEYVKNGGNASAAYKAAYPASRKWKENAVNVAGSKMLARRKVSVRIEALRKAAEKRNEISIDRVLKEITAIAFVDPSEIWDDEGNMKPISEIPESARRAIVGLEKKVVTGQSSEETLKAKLADKNAALEKLMKHLGGYERDNKQKQAEVIVVGVPKEFDGDD